MKYESNQALTKLLDWPKPSSSTGDLQVDRENAMLYLGRLHQWDLFRYFADENKKMKLSEICGHLFPNS